MKTKSIILAVLLVAGLSGCGKNSTGNTFGGAGAPSTGPTDKKDVKQTNPKGSGGPGGSYGP